MSVKRRKKQALIFLFLVSTILFIDQCFKLLIYKNLTVGQSIPIIRDILHITLVRNTGAAFGLFKNHASLFIIISIIAILFISVLIFRAIKKEEYLSNFRFNIGLTIIASGALGNLIDRLRLGYVIDYIDVRIWPVFNVADTSITIGTFLLIFSFISSSVTNPK